MKTTFSLMKS